MHIYRNQRYIVVTEGAAGMGAHSRENTLFEVEQSSATGLFQSGLKSTPLDRMSRGSIDSGQGVSAASPAEEHAGLETQP